MIQTVVKRDGRIVGFNEQKIMAAVRKAMLHTDKGEDERLVQQIADRIGFVGKPQMTVEDIQNQVEMELMKSSRKDVARAYISYRNQRSVARKAKTRDVLLPREQPSLRLDEDGHPVPWEEGQEARVPPHDEGPGIRDARERRPRPAARRERHPRPAARGRRCG